MSLIYDFDDVRVDPAAFRVTKAGRPVPLEPKAFEVLVFLLENPGRLVEKKELLEKLWPDAVVTESAMTRVIADLRRALGDAAREARYIETVPTKGYRFIADVRPATAPATPAAPAAARRGAPARIAIGVLALGVLAALAFRATRPKPLGVPPPVSAKLTQVTSDLGLDTSPSFSPDGAQVAYSSDRLGPSEIFVRQLAPGGRDIRITSDGRGNYQPAWSPDGREIAYASRAVPGIWVLPALGGAPRRLTSFGSRPAWSPDGATIAFQSKGIVDISAPSAAPPSTLWIVPAGGGEPRPLTLPGSPVGGHGSPVFSRDGREVVFAAWSFLGELWSVSLQDGSLRKILPTGDARRDSGESRRQYFDPAFSPKGDVLYFVATDISFLNTGLWRARAPAEPGGQWGTPERVTPGGAASIGEIAVSPRTGTIAYTAVSMVSNVWSLPLDPKTSAASGEPVLLTRSSGGRNTTPRFSPDGSRIAFVSALPGSPLDVWVMNADGSDARPITNGSREATFPDWFPSGDRVAYFSAQERRKELWAVSLDDRSQQRLLVLRAEELPGHLSADGRFLATSRGSRESGLETWVTPLDGGPAKRLTPPGTNAGWPCWSRDGGRLALEVVGATDTLLATVPSTGGAPKVVVSARGLSWPSDWSPDGAHIVFAGLRDGIWNVFRTGRGGGAETRLTGNATGRIFVRFPTWSPRGDRIAYEQTETTGNVWLAEPPP